MVSGLYAILDVPSRSRLAPEDRLRAMLAGGRGANLVQLRAKRMDTAARSDLARRLAPICAEAGVGLIINDDPALALEGLPGLGGLHLGQDDLAAVDLSELAKQLRAQRRVLGISTHDLAQVRAAEAIGPDYIGFGPVFPTRSKSDTEPLVGLHGLRAACRETSLPLVAIGGIDRPGARRCFECGANAVAVIGALDCATLAEISDRARAIAALYDGGVEGTTRA